MSRGFLRIAPPPVGEGWGRPARCARTGAPHLAWMMPALLICGLARAAVGGQGAGRLLYSVPNNGFIEQPSGESVVTVTDNSGVLTALQLAINNARAANPGSILVIHLLGGATYWVTDASFVLGAHECLLGAGAIIQAASPSVIVPLVQVAAGATNVSLAGVTLDGSGAYIQGIYAPAAARVNVDLVTVRNCGQDCILLKGNGNSIYDNEMSVTRCDCSGSPGHAGISIQNATQTVVVDNNAHDNAQGIYLSCAWATVANNTCSRNLTGIDVAGGDDNVVVNNTCNSNSVGIHAGSSNNMLASNALGGNTSAGMASDGSGNTFVDNLFTAGNAVNFTSAGSGNRVVAYHGTLSAPGQDYFYPPLASDPHTNAIVNGLGRTDVTISSTTIDNVQGQYNSARAANPNNVMVLHLNGTFSVGAAPLTLASNTCVLLNGTLQISSSTGASGAVAGTNAPVHVSLSGGIIDGGNLTGNNGIQFSTAGMLQVDGMTLRNFGPANPRTGGSDVVHFDHGTTPYIVTRCTINGGSARGIWLQLSGQKSVISDNEVTAVNQDGVDCDSSTFGSVVKFNYCHDLVRYGVFFEQSASHNLALGNVCNNDGRDINLYNNSTTPRGATAYNSVVCNACLGSNGLRNGSTGTNAVETSHNFLFNNTVVNASISSELYGSQNYYSQNYQSGGSLSTAGTEAFFNSATLTNLFLQDSGSGLAVLVQNAATNNGAAVVIDTTSGLGNDQWQLVPTDSGYCKIISQRSGLALAIQNASTNVGASAIQWAFGSAKNDQWLAVSSGDGLYNFINRLSGLYLEVAGGSLLAGTQLDQQAPNGTASQRFRLAAALVTGSFSLSASPSAQAILPGSNTTFTTTISTNSGFSGSVVLGCTGLPPGAIGGFSPGSLAGNGSSILSITTLTNVLPGNYTLVLSGTNGSTVASATVTLKIASSAGSPGTLVWTAGGGSLEWSAPANWTNVTTGGFGPPGISNDVVFANFATATTSNLADNVVNSDTAINSLACSATNGFHTTEVVAGATLTIAGAKGLTAGTESDAGTNAAVYETITGSDATLSISNPVGGVLVRQYTAGASGGSQRATLDLSGLGNFTLAGNRLEVGTFAGTGTARSAGTVSLARNNTLRVFMRAQGVTTNAGIDLADNPLANSSQASFLFLGQQTAVYADGLTVGGGRNIGWMGFNAGFDHPAAYFRGTNGDLSRVTRWAVGDNSGASSTGSNSRGTNDFTAGTLDALVDTMILGRGESPTMGSGSSTGVVMFAQGILDVNTLLLGAQANGAAGGAGSGTPGTNYLGQIDVDGSATLVINSNLQLTGVASGNPGAMRLFATLNLNGGTIQAVNVAGGSGFSALNLNRGLFDSGGGSISNVSAINLGASGQVGAAWLRNAARISSGNPIAVAANGILSGNTLVSAPALIVNGTLSPGINDGVGGLTNSGNLTFGAGGNLVLAVQDALGGPDPGWSFLEVGGVLDLEAAATNAFTIRVQSFDPNGSGVVTNFDLDTNYLWTVAAAGGGITRFDPAVVKVDTDDFLNDLGGGYFFVATNGEALSVCFTNNHPPVGGTVALYRRAETLAFPISTLAAHWSDPDGDPVELVSVDGSTNGALVSTDGTYIYYRAPVGAGLADAILYTVRDVRTNPPAAYRAGDTTRFAQGQVILLPPPAISGVVHSEGSLVLSGTNGPPGGLYFVLASTNVATPLNQWPRMATNSFDAQGNFRFTNALQPNEARSFFLLQLP